MYRDILFEKAPPIGLITLNRPTRLNAWTPEMAGEMRHALLQVEKDPALRVSIVTGAGRGFCAGADLSAGTEIFEAGSPGSPEERDVDPEPASHILWTFALKKPVVAAVNGPAVGVGVTMILPFDLRIAAESARLGFVFNRRGLLPEMASPWLLPKIVGISRAAELMYTGRLLSAREALEAGLVSRVVPDADLLPAAKALAREIAENCAPVSIALTRKMLYDYLTRSDVEEMERQNHRYFMWAAGQPDAGEGVAAFLEKRPPAWKMKVPGDLPDF